MFYDTKIWKKKRETKIQYKFLKGFERQVIFHFILISTFFSFCFMYPGLEDVS